MDEKTFNAILGLIQDWNGFNSKVYLQKFLFFLNDLNWKNISLNYIKYKFGAFAQEIDTCLTRYSELDLIKISRNNLNFNIEPQGENIKIFFNTNGINLKSNKLDDKLEYMVNEFFGKLKELEIMALASSIHIIIITDILFERRFIFNSLKEWKENLRKYDLYFIWNKLIEFYIKIILHFLNKFHFNELVKNFKEALGNLHSQYSRKSPLIMMRVVLEGTWKRIIQDLNQKPKSYPKNLEKLEKLGIIQNNKKYFKLYSMLSQFFAHYNESMVNQKEYFYQTLIALYLLLTKYNKWLSNRNLLSYMSN